MLPIYTQEEKSVDQSSRTKREAVIIDDLKANAKLNNNMDYLFEKILSIDNDNYGNWELVVDKKNIKIQKLKTEDSPDVLIRSTAFCEGIPPKQIFDMIYDTAYRQRWDTVLTNFHVVQTIDAFTDIMYFLVKAPSFAIGIANRDFVQERKHRVNYPEPGDIIISSRSINHPAMPPQKHIIRGEIIISGYIIRPSQKDPRSSELVIINQSDIKGYIPKTIVNHAVAKAPLEWVDKMMKACVEGPIRMSE